MSGPTPAIDCAVCGHVDFAHASWEGCAYGGCDCKRVNYGYGWLAPQDRPTAAALDYAETALSECWAVLRRIAAGESDPARIAADLLEAHGHNLTDGAS